MGLRRGNRPEQPQDTWTDHEVFDGGVPQDATGQAGYDQSTPRTRVIDDGHGNLIYSGSREQLSPEVAEAFLTLQRLNAQQSGVEDASQFADTRQDSPSGVPYDWSDNEVSLTVTTVTSTQTKFSAEVSNPDILDVASQAVAREKMLHDLKRASEINKGGCSAGSASVPLEYTRPPQQPYYQVDGRQRQIESGAHAQGHPQDYSRDYPQDELPANGPSAPDRNFSQGESRVQNGQDTQDTEKRRSNKKSTYLVRTVAAVSLAAVVGGLGVGMDKAMTFVYQFGGGGSNHPYLSDQGIRNTKRFPLVGDLVANFMPNVRGDSSADVEGK